MNGYVEAIDTPASAHCNFRSLLYTGHNLQLVLMSLAPGEDIGSEIHRDRDKFFRVESGEGMVEIDGHFHKAATGTAILVPAGSRRNFINTGSAAVKLCTLYGPPNHLDRQVQGTKAEASASSERFAGDTTE